MLNVLCMRVFFKYSFFKMINTCLTCYNVAVAEITNPKNMILDGYYLLEFPMRDADSPPNQYETIFRLLSPSVLLSVSYRLSDTSKHDDFTFSLIDRVRRTVRGSADDIGWLQRDSGMLPVEDGTEKFMEILENVRYLLVLVTLLCLHMLRSVIPWLLQLFFPLTGMAFTDCRTQWFTYWFQVAFSILFS